MAAADRKDHPLLYDVKRPLDLSQVKRGWYAAAKTEYDYWVPQADIVGKIPPSLRGTLFRNGPGLLEIYGKRLIHPIDGDGMIVALTFVDGQVHLRSRFVASKERMQEQEQRKFLYRGQMGTHPNSALKDTAIFLKSMLTLSWPKLRYRNPSNTNVFYWGGKVVSCYETGLPHTLDPYTLDTLGLDDFNGTLKLRSFAAHFRLDMKNNRLVCISLKPGVGTAVKPALAIYEFDQSWNLLQQQYHTIDGLNYAHDFLLLPDYYVFHMTPFAAMTFKSVLLVYTGWSSPGQQMQYYSYLPSRFVVIPRHKGAKYQDIQFMDTEPFHIFHFGTADQKGDIITFNAVCLGPKFNMTFDKEIWLSNASVAPGNVWSFSLNLTSGKCERSMEPADPASVEFPSVHPYRHGLSNCRYSYLMASDRKGYNLPYRDVVKYDTKCENRQVWYSHGAVGEPVFVPRLGWESWKMGDEDDGFVIVQLYIPETHRTEFAILDAKHIDQGPIASIRLKHHIPYGFHGTFTPEVFTGQHFVKSRL